MHRQRIGAARANEAAHGCRDVEIIGEAEPTNIGSHRVMEKAGMVRVESDGDLIRYAITRAR